MGLLRKALDSATGKLSGTSGYERRELIAAAHTTIVVAAFFEASPRGSRRGIQRNVQRY